MLLQNVQVTTFEVIEMYQEYVDRRAVQVSAVPSLPSLVWLSHDLKVCLPCLSFTAFLINPLHLFIVRYSSYLILMASNDYFTFIFICPFGWTSPAFLHVRTAQKSCGAIEVALLCFTLSVPLYPLPLCLNDFPCSSHHVPLHCTSFPQFISS